MAPAIPANRAKKRPNFMEVVVWRFKGADSASAMFDSVTAAAVAAKAARLPVWFDPPIAPLVPGFSLHREMQHLVAAGLTPKQALQAATRNSADAAGKLATTGAVERGKQADFVLLDVDPLQSMANSVLTAYESRARSK